MKRREFITLVGGAAAGWPLAVRAQQSERMRRVGVLMGQNADDPDAQANIAALHQGLQEAGWAIGRNVQVDVRWGGGDIARLRKEIEALVALNPDVIVAGPGPTMPILKQTTSTMPVVFAQSVDPVGNGFVNSMSRPGGNITGFTQFEYSLTGKWLELLKELVPQVSRVGVVRELAGPVAIGQWAVIQAFAGPAGIELTPLNLGGTADVERTLSGFSHGQNEGLIVVVGLFTSTQREQVIALAARHRLPAVYSNRSFVVSGGLISYGTNLLNNYRRAASYVDRILKGEKPADLPVQAPTKYELVINLKTAKVLGLTVPATLLARADEVIE